MDDDAFVQHCAACGKALEHVFAPTELLTMRSLGWQNLPPNSFEGRLYSRELARVPDQFDNALHINAGGGYGEFYDVIPGADYPHAVLCHACAHALCEREPWLAKILRLDEGQPHTHREDQA